MKLRTILAAAAMALFPMIASASTVNEMTAADSGSTIALLDFTSHQIEADYQGNQGAVDLSYTFTVDAADAPMPAIAAAVNLIFQGSVEGLYMNWAGTNVITDSFTFTELGAGIHSATLTLNTLFAAPGDLSQNLNIGFTSFSGQQIQLSVGVAAVPLPAGILLMGTALGGLGLARRRKLAA